MFNCFQHLLYKVINCKLYARLAVVKLADLIYENSHAYTQT